MNPAQRHHIPSVAVRQILPVTFRILRLDVVVRNGDIALIGDKRRIGKRPHILGLVHRYELLVNLAGVKSEKLLSFFGRWRHIRVDLRLVLAEIIDNIGVVRERVETQGKIAVSCDPQAFFFQAEVPLKKQ